MSEDQDEKQKMNTQDIPDEAQKESEEDHEKYSFMQETLKDEQISTKKVWMSVLRTAGRGIIFGLAACLAFYALKPWVEPRLTDPSTEVTIPKDEEEGLDEEAQEEIEDAGDVLTMSDYQELDHAIYQTAVDAMTCVVEVHAEGDSFPEKGFKDYTSVSGMIVWNQGAEILILVPSRILDGGTTLSVKFCDTMEYPATLKKRDLNLGLAVIAVDRYSVLETTLGQIHTATFGNSNLVSRGDTVIALGRPFGCTDAVGYGIVSTTKNYLERPDRVCKILATDIAGTPDGSGVLFNTNGEAIGFIDQKMVPEDKSSVVVAYSISDIKEDIELLSNGYGIPYLGVQGVTVTEEIEESTGIPKGVYVKQIEADSPAMAAGIQNGDVITQIEKTNVTALSVYQKALMKLEPGEVVKIKGLRYGVAEYVEVEFTVTVGSRE